MFVSLICLLFFLQAKDPPVAEVGPTFGKPNPELWNSVYSDPSPSFSTAPNAFMTEVVKGLKPGRALEIGVGQGRNSVYLAKLGWDVTGFDIAERGMEIARKSAKAAGVKITTVNSTLEAFDYGVSRWDLIVATYEGASWLEQAVRGLKPGGVVVLETYGKSPQAPGGGFEPNQLPRLFMGQNLRILRYEDVEATPDWIKEAGRVVRMFAQKPN